MIDIHAHIDFEKSSIEECLQDMQKNHIEQRVISSLNHIHSGVEIEKIIESVKENEKRLIGCMLVDPSRDDALQFVQSYIKNPAIMMIEFDSYRHGYFPELTKGLIDILDYVQEVRPDIVIKVFTGIGAKSIPHQWEIVAKKYPMINFVFLHIGCFDYGYSCVDVVKRNENVFTEFSNQYEMQILRKAFSELDDSKILFGTTYPERLSSSAIDVIDLFDLPQETREKYFNNNAMRLLYESKGGHNNG